MLRKVFKGLVLCCVLIFALVVFGYIYIVNFKPNIPVENLMIESTPARIERGKYLANYVSRCMDCHSTRDWSKFSGPAIEGTEGKGGELFDRKQGYPGNFYAANLTPYHLKEWTDGELFRAITAGVSKDDHPLFPSMPYINYGKMDREDIYSIIAYIRSLPAITNDVPTSKAAFPMSIIGHLIPTKGELLSKPLESDQLNYGKYLATAASCVECHTQTKRGIAIEGMEFAGGRYMTLPNGTTTVSSNITPDKDTGIGNWTMEMFIQQFKVFDHNAAINPVKEGEFNTVMPRP